MPESQTHIDATPRSLQQSANIYRRSLAQRIKLALND
jgi:hypothetical protein